MYDDQPTKALDGVIMIATGAMMPVLAQARKMISACLEAYRPAGKIAQLQRFRFKIAA